MYPKETTIYNAILIAGCVIGTIIIYFIVSGIRQHRRHLQLYQANLESEIGALEKERTRFAADLHDDLGPVLSAAKFKLSSIESLSGEEGKLVSDAMGYIDNILEQVRQIANDLMPNTLLHHGPVAAIEEFIDHISANNSLNIIFHETNIPDLPRSEAIHVYRIIQEIIHNTIKHAEAKQLTIELCYSKNKFVIATVDNGKGFNYNDALKKGKCRGLGNLRSRSEILGGEMHVNSKIGAGTSYIIEFPLIRKPIAFV